METTAPTSYQKKSPPLRVADYLGACHAEGNLLKEKRYLPFLLQSCFVQVLLRMELMYTSGAHFPSRPKTGG